MSLYRETAAGGRRVAIATVVALLVGLGAGYLVGSGGEETASLEAALADLRSELAPARDGLDLLPNEYAQGVRDARVVAATEYGAAQADLDRATQAIEANRADLAALDPAGTDTLDRTLGELDASAKDLAPQTVIDRLARAAGTQLQSIVPPPELRPGN